MNSPILERLASISFKTIEPSVFFALQKRLEEFLKSSGKEWNLVGRINQPVVSLPREASESGEPNWSKMKLGVDRCFKYRRSDGLALMQFCNSFLSVNVAKPEMPDSEQPTFKHVKDALLELVPFLQEELLQKIHVANFQYEVVARLTEEHFPELLETRYKKGQKDYLNVFELLRSFSSAANRDEWELSIPLKQELVYHIKNDPEHKKLAARIVVNHNVKQGWFANLEFKAYSDGDDTTLTGGERLNRFVDMLNKLDSLQKTGLERILTDKVYNTVKDVIL